ncbi:hypothetical protein [Kamptonema sp. UHCC 0994]|uniref:hypothetical protein n=1 Tax=Kamptonema sp. UHCC 0994 TaxID=3031329 RepID=UPI0023B8AE19|nr:hypothetical protein [Kamptonema sp. UHCC 0994]MDF0553263.1 hypothetical protein [Kamptonema sp. UHCC 0994]
MTLCAAWIHHTSTDDQELVFATDSCLSAGERWEAGVKLFELPRKDCFICFAGETSRAYPMILNLIHSIEASPTLKNPQTDLLDVMRHAEGLFTDLAQAIDLSDLSSRDYDDARGAAKFIFGGWRWQTSEFYVWRLAYNSTSERFVTERCFLDDSEPVCFIGDLESDDLIVEIYEEVGMADIQLNMQPLKLLIRKIRDISRATSGIRGAPQIGKIYRSGNSKLFGVMWQSIEGKPHYQSRPVLGIQNMVHQYFDPDTCELINNCPGRKPDVGDFLNEDEQVFISLCYNEDDDLKLDLNEFQRGKLQEILRQVAYKHFLNTVTMIEQPEAES